MTFSRRVFLPILVVAGTAAIAGCGSSTLSEDQLTELEKRAASLQVKVQEAGDKADACATDNKAKTEGAKGIGKCLGTALTTASTQIDDINDYVKELAGSASGDCKDKLNGLSDALGQTSGSLGDAAATANKGDLEGITKELQSVSTDQVDVTVAGREADKACGG
ncbi:MAG: hypothetical protein FGM34_10400 [Solirubrobacteraceae bacterium]|nr:hypothetical protein [Solirubrobacteraceae bacterium]